MAHKNKKKQDYEDMKTMVNELERTTVASNLAEDMDIGSEIEHDDVNHRDTGMRDSR
ncbi:hypothetical protein [Aneurinibacillus thermoaerophilus]|nr:hypothetical protein [Aneurinibacillus thermoaerophilus]